MGWLGETSQCRVPFYHLPAVLLGLRLPSQKSGMCRLCKCGARGSYHSDSLASAPLCPATLRPSQPLCWAPQPLFSLPCARPHSSRGLWKGDCLQRNAIKYTFAACSGPWVQEARCHPEGQGTPAVLFPSPARHGSSLPTCGTVAWEAQQALLA